MRRWRLCLTVCLALAAPPAWSLEEGQQLALRDVVMAFAESVRLADDKGVRAATCAERMVEACVVRELDLGIALPEWYLEDPQADPELLVSAVDGAYLAAIYRAFGPLFTAGDVTGLSVAGITELEEQGPDAESLGPAPGPGDPPLAIGAQGTILVKVSGRPSPAPMSAFLLDGAWCLNPVLVPSIRDF